MLVHYFVRKPGAVGELIYPSELPDGPYRGFGAFFLTGENVDDLASEYIFYGIMKDEILPILLRRRGNTSTFLAEVPNVGLFRFRANGIVPVPLYTGDFPLGARRAFRQLSIADHSGLEAAAHEQDFYFVGFTPMIDDAAARIIEKPPGLR